MTPEQIIAPITQDNHLNGQQGEPAKKTRLDEYYEFLESKIKLAKPTGFEVEDSELHSSNFHHQREVIKWAAKKGRAGIFRL